MINSIDIFASSAGGQGLCTRATGQAGLALCIAAMAALTALCGCSSSSSTKPQVVSIAVTDVNGTVQPTLLTSLAVNTAISLDVTLSNDNSGLGADWTVACGSAPPPGTPLPPGQTVTTACGTFTPVHTLSAPVPSYVSQGAGYVTLYTAPAVPPQGGIVTLYAAAAADPSRYASLAFPIVGLPVSVGFAPQPPASIAVSGTALLKAVVSNDYTPRGVIWSVLCGSSVCGSFSPVQTASGLATTYTAPATVPTGGTVTISATSVTDATKSVSATIAIAPISVTVAPATLSVAVGGTGLLNATVANDVTNAGVDWSASCASPGACGSITPHTASGAASTYTAPSDVPAGDTVTLTATATAGKTAAGSAMVTVTPTATPTVSGLVRSGAMPVDGAALSLYAAGEAGYEAGYGSAATLLNDKTLVASDGSGRFTIASDRACPKADSLLYVVALHESADGKAKPSKAKPSLVMMTGLGPCNRLSSSNAVVIDEATTVAAAYALSPFMRDAAHVGTPISNRVGMANAFRTADQIADSTTGEPRTETRSGAAVPQAKVNTLANLLHACATVAEVPRVDLTVCAASDTLQVALSIARGSGGAFTATQIFELAEREGAFQPALRSAPADWTLSLTYPSQTAATAARPEEETGFPTEATRSPAVDSAGNRWLLDSDGTVIETVGTAAPRVR